MTVTMYSTVTCGKCKTLEPKLREIAPDLIVQVLKGTEVVVAYHNIRQVPCVIVERDNEVLGRTDGEASVEKVKEMLISAGYIKQEV